MSDVLVASQPHQTPEFVQVLVDCIGIEELLTYRIPAEMTVQIGDILSVPLGNRHVGAIALHFPNQQELAEFTGETKAIAAIVSTGMLSPKYWELLLHTADYYRTALMQTVKVALPPKLMDQGCYRVKIRQEQTERGETVNSHPIPALSPAAQAVWAFLEEHAQSKKGMSRRYIQQQVGRSANAGLRELQQFDLIATVLDAPQRPQPKFVDAIVLLPTPDSGESQPTARQTEILTALQREGGESPKAEFLKLAKTTVTALQTLANKGYIAIDRREYLRLGGKSHFVTADRPKQLTPEQAQALAKILEAIQTASVQKTTQQLLLHGVTGSGKTEVYLQAIAPVLAAGKSALVLVPEIGLTPQLTDRFRARFGDAKVNVYHSQLSAGERFDTWRQMLTGDAQVVVGTRSAVFAPLPKLGLIVMDEEHDGSFKQDQPQPCYHARTVSQWRSQLEGIPLVLGSATPSAEMLYLANGQKLLSDADRVKLPKGESNHHSNSTANSNSTESATDTIQYLKLPNRIGNKPMPPIAVVDMREELQAGNWSIFSRTLRDAIARMLEQKKQGILFIHRRGHSTFVSCRSCGYVMKCRHCDVSLAYHNPLPMATSAPTVSHLRCHYCNYTEAKPNRCPACNSAYFKHFGSGTQKVEQEIAELFPQIRLIRFDSDTTRNKDQHRLLLDRFRDGEADLLIGTQMLTKGLDIPQVTFVGAISADGLLNFSDYRAGERAFQTLIQVAGRAGRGDDAGEVIVQTYTPEHPVIEAVRNYTSEQFMQVELSQRAALNYPPIGQMALIHLSSADAIVVETAANQLAESLRSLEMDWELLGPAPASIVKVANRYRWQILLKFAPEHVSSLPSLDILRSLVNQKSVRVAIDVDPLTIL
ncbi:primosomal protein N' [Tumidithrix helvetica PCC 7403]|uniref:primosomal protein N' n=1 Tax=Tumidithrix helvetica TaxID=3457545 RepID=UPI003CADF361